MLKNASDEETMNKT